MEIEASQRTKPSSAVRTTIALLFKNVNFKGKEADLADGAAARLDRVRNPQTQEANVAVRLTGR
jgi:hypothetical protein